MIMRRKKEEEAILYYTSHSSKPIIKKKKRRKKKSTTLGLWWYVPANAIVFDSPIVMAISRSQSIFIGHSLLIIPSCGLNK